MTVSSTLVALGLIALGPVAPVGAGAPELARPLLIADQGQGLNRAGEALKGREADDDDKAKRHRERLKRGYGKPSAGGYDRSHRKARGRHRDDDGRPKGYHRGMRGKPDLEEMKRKHRARSRAMGAGTKPNHVRDQDAHKGRPKGWGERLGRRHKAGSGEEKEGDERRGMGPGYGGGAGAMGGAGGASGRGGK